MMQGPRLQVPATKKNVVTTFSPNVAFSKNARLAGHGGVLWVSRVLSESPNGVLITLLL